MQSIFKIIPGYDKYLIDKNGNVFNTILRKFLKGSTNPAGYVLYRLTNNCGKTLTWGRHRLLGFVYLNPDKDISNLIVNHKNGIKGDDRLENLEWMTYRENIEHAGLNGLTSNCIPVSTKDVKTGKIEIYPSVVACSEALGLSKDAVLWRLKHDSSYVYPEGMQYRKGISDEDWLVSSMYRNGRLTPVIGFDMLEKKEIYFDSLSQVSLQLGVSLTTAFEWLNKKNQPIFKQRYLLKYLEDKAPWRMVTDAELEFSYSLVKRRVRVFNLKSETWTIYSSLKDAANAVGIKYTTAHFRANSKPGIIHKDGFALEYML